MPIVPQLLRFRVGLVALLAVFLIPIAQSSLRGVGHVLTCTDLVESPFEVILVPAADPVVIGTTSLTDAEPPTLCGGLAVDVGVSRSDRADVEVRVSLVNLTSANWFGSMRLDVGGVTLPVDLGRVRAGEQEVRVLDLDLPDGTTGFGGSLLIGP